MSTKREINVFESTYREKLQKAIRAIAPRTITIEEMGVVWKAAVRRTRLSKRARRSINGERGRGRERLS